MPPALEPTSRVLVFSSPRIKAGGTPDQCSHDKERATMYRQSDLRFTFQPLVGKAEFEVVSFTLNEGISTPFVLELKLISFEHDINFDHLLDNPVLFTTWEGEPPVRYVHGLVSSFNLFGTLH
jgi:uncharacterized protein involved in type VI secretion and phage assembly